MKYLGKRQMEEGRGHRDQNFRVESQLRDVKSEAAYLGYSQDHTAGVNPVSA